MRIPIRVKLAAALAVPLFATGMVTLFEVTNLNREAAEVRDQTNLADATIGPGGLITALQDERNWVAAYLVGFHELVPMAVVGFDDTRAGTNGALEDFEQELAGWGEAASDAYAPALEGLGTLDALRDEIDEVVDTTELTIANIGPTTEYFDRYTALIEPFFGALSRISIAMDDPELRQGSSLMETVTRQIETVPQLTNAIALPAEVSTGPGDEAGINSPGEISELAQLNDQFVRQAAELRAAGGRYAAVAEEQFPTEFTRRIEEEVANGLAGAKVDVNAFIADLDVGTADLPYLGYRNDLASAIDERADQLNAEASDRELRYGLLLVSTFVAAVILTIVVSRSITRPLRSLTNQATEMADRRLPDAVTQILDTPLGDDVTMPTVTPVRVVTRDEVADVAEALTTVQDSALDLAVEQAVLRRNIADSFVNLGRRNQNLLGRQLDFITELESREVDPETLASLFRLDHLATRMRRNAESLLVLAGIEPPRQWAAPVRLADVIRAALGEVENYQRVTIRSVEPSTVVGSAAADLAHLLAELIENALVFSPPDRTVEIRGQIRPDGGPGHPGGYTLAVLDAGFGMSEIDLEAANRRLAGAESFTVAPSRYLGHYVAGNLAARHDITVHLHNTPGGGITARVELPADILAPEQAGHPGSDGPGLPPGPSRNGHALASRRPVAAPPVRAPAPAPQAWSAPGPAPVPAPAPAPAPLAAGPLPRRDEYARQAPIAPTDAQVASLAHLTGRGPTAQRGGPVARGAAGPTGPAGRPPTLARRERGAQMPTTTPLPLRHAPAAPTPGPRPQPAARPATPQPQTSRAALEVYGFLSSFSAGVQRGLEASRHAPGGSLPGANPAM